MLTVLNRANPLIPDEKAGRSDIVLCPPLLAKDDCFLKCYEYKSVYKRLVFNFYDVPSVFSNC